LAASFAARTLAGVADKTCFKAEVNAWCCSFDDEGRGFIIDTLAACSKKSLAILLKQN
jgi:predicted metal-binding transcription factor (methanogenesis marker protein 9)